MRNVQNYQTGKYPVQADPSLYYGHRSLCCFCPALAHIVKNCLLKCIEDLTQVIISYEIC